VPGLGALERPGTHGLAQFGELKREWLELPLNSSRRYVPRVRDGLDGGFGSGCATLAMAQGLAYKLGELHSDRNFRSPATELIDIDERTAPGARNIPTATRPAHVLQ
jgi:hypothetical protein